MKKHTQMWLAAPITVFLFSPLITEAQVADDAENEGWNRVCVNSQRWSFTKELVQKSGQDNAKKAKSVDDFLFNGLNAGSEMLMKAMTYIESGMEAKQKEAEIQEEWEFNLVYDGKSVMEIRDRQGLVLKTFSFDSSEPHSRVSYMEHWFTAPPMEGRVVSFTPQTNVLKVETNNGLHYVVCAEPAEERNDQ